MKLPTPNKDIQKLGNLLIEQYGFRFIGVDSREHLEFEAPNGAEYKLSCTPKGSFSTSIELPRALKLAGLNSQTGKRDPQRLKERAARFRDNAKARERIHDDELAAAVAAAENVARNNQLRRRLDSRRSELISISHLMGAGHPRTF